MKTAPRFLAPSLILVLALIAALYFSVSFAQQNCTPLTNTSRPPWPRNSTVYVNFGNLNAEQRRQVQAALDSWNAANANNGSHVTFSNAAPPQGGIVLNVAVGQTTTQNGVTPPAQFDSTGHVDANGNLNGGTLTFSNSVTAAGPNGQPQLALDEGRRKPPR